MNLRHLTEAQQIAILEDLGFEKAAPEYDCPGGNIYTPAPTGKKIYITYGGILAFCIETLFVSPYTGFSHWSMMFYRFDDYHHLLTL